jgi:hypothetical protein
MIAMTRDIERRIKRLEDPQFRHREETGPDLAAILLERRRKRAIAEGREPEPDPPRARLVYSGGRVSIAEVLLHDRRKVRERANSAPGGKGTGTGIATNGGPCRRE